jgi:hypothetical protein
MISKGLFLIFVSMIIFGILNIIENIIHYNIGINSGDDKIFKFIFPSRNDFKKIFIIMIIFGSIQGILTELIVED